VPAGVDEGAHRFGDAHRRSQAGSDLSRPIALADGVFAFALTLLVLQLTVPLGVCASTSSSTACSTLVAQALSNDYRAFIGYVEAFLIISIWWFSHHRLFRYIERYDAVLLWLNLGFLLTVAVAPFFVGLFLQYPETSVGLLLFSLEMAAAGFLLAGIWAYAGHAGLLSAEADPAIRRYVRLRGVVIPGFFVLGAAVSLVAPPAVQFIWLGAFVASFYLRRYA
jgi:TMEM175 potassium channel family protein